MDFWDFLHHASVLFISVMLVIIIIRLSSYLVHFQDHKRLMTKMFREIMICGCALKDTIFFIRRICHRGCTLVVSEILQTQMVQMSTQITHGNIPQSDLTPFLLWKNLHQIPQDMRYHSCCADEKSTSSNILLNR